MLEWVLVLMINSGQPNSHSFIAQKYKSEVDCTYNGKMIEAAANEKRFRIDMPIPLNTVESECILQLTTK